MVCYWVMMRRCCDARIPNIPIGIPSMHAFVSTNIISTHLITYSTGVALRPDGHGMAPFMDPIFLTTVRCMASIPCSHPCSNPCSSVYPALCVRLARTLMHTLSTPLRTYSILRTCNLHNTVYRYSVRTPEYRPIQRPSVTPYSILRYHVTCTHLL